MSPLNVLKVNSTIGRISRWAFWGRRLDTRPGDIMVIPEGVLDYENEPREYRDGEIVYVGNHRAMLDRQVIVFREYVGDMAASMSRNYMGFGHLRANIRITVRMVDAIQYLRRETDIANPVAFDTVRVAELEALIMNILHDIFEELNFNSKYINQRVINAVNEYLKGFGMVTDRNEAIVDVSFPDVVAQIRAECQAIDEWLVTSVTKYNQSAQIGFLMRDYAELFTNEPVANEWLAGVYNRSRGRPFFDLAMKVPTNVLVEFCRKHQLVAMHLIDYHHALDHTDPKAVRDSNKIVRDIM